MQTIDVGRLTANQPFCAGAVLIRDKKMVGTLNSDGIPKELRGRAWRVGGVGGGQEPGETLWECAAREAREETGVDLPLRDSRTSIFHDVDTDQFYSFRHDGLGPAPMLLERKGISDDSTPFKPGLPTGQFLFLALFLGEVPASADLMPSDDVVALIGLSIEAWIHVPTEQPTLRSALSGGAKLFNSTDLEPNRILWTPPDESFVSLARAIHDRKLGGELGL